MAMNSGHRAGCEAAGHRAGKARSEVFKMGSGKEWLPAARQAFALRDSTVVVHGSGKRVRSGSVFIVQCKSFS